VENKRYVAAGVLSVILVITTREHAYTHQMLRRQPGLDLHLISYDEILKRKRPFRGTHIFTDFERLPPWRVQQAAVLYRRLKSAGVRVLNDPARALGRFGLLRALHRAGINQFDAYRVDGLETVARWPVFLRLEGNHSEPLSRLLHNEAELEEAIGRAIDEGAPRNALVIIEYAAEPVRPGLYRKLSVFRVGDRLLGYTCVHDDKWLVKYGQPGIAPPELYEEEYSFVANNPFAAAVEPVFRLAGIEYGRIDFGLVGGRPQIYEINNNPYVELDPEPSPADMRNQSTALFKVNYIGAMAEIDTERRPSWKIKTSTLVRSVRLAPVRARTFLGQAKRRLKTAAGSATVDQPSKSLPDPA
jgi:hypothetical protein